MATESRNRVIYQSEALFVSPTATGGHYTGAARKTQKSASDGPGYAEGSALRQLKRVQSANYSFTVNRQDVNQFDKLARIDSLVVDTPTVNMDFSYYITDGENERLLGFVIDGQTNTMSGHMSPDSAGQNFFILTVPEGQDAVGGDTASAASEKSVISMGNGYITDYSVEAAVGGFPTASVSVEGFNIKSNTGYNQLDIPAIDPTDGSRICDSYFTVPASQTGQGASALRPGDITIDLQNAGLLARQVSGVSAKDQPPGAAHIQSVSINVPMSRTVLQRLGNTFGFSRELDVPITATFTVNALVADLKTDANGTNMLDLLCGNQKNDLRVILRDPSCIDCDKINQVTGMYYDFKGALLESESYSSSIGDNKTVDLTFTCQIGGPTDTQDGVFISGSNSSPNGDTTVNRGRPPFEEPDGTLRWFGPLDDGYPNRADAS